jgi:hypothetical protein
MNLKHITEKVRLVVLHGLAIIDGARCRLVAQVARCAGGIEGRAWCGRREARVGGRVEMVGGVGRAIPICAERAVGVGSVAGVDAERG